MPKEYVHDAHYGAEYVSYGLDGTPTPIPSPMTFQVKVGWNKETGDVQIATVNEDAEPFSAAGGLHVNLDRQGINDLIRHLRRARDQAFGRDE
jgi:hypothetical protein